jgi:hypothetical protein
MSCVHYHDLLRLRLQKSTWDCRLFINDEVDNQWMIHDLVQSLRQKHKLVFPARYNGLVSKPDLIVAVKMSALCSGSVFMFAVLTPDQPQPEHTLSHSAVNRQRFIDQGLRRSRGRCRLHRWKSQNLCPLFFVGLHFKMHPQPL